MDPQTLLLLQNLKPKQRDELMTRALMSGEFPSEEELKEMLIIGETAGGSSVTKSSVGKARSEALGIMRMCGITDDGHFDDDNTDPLTGLKVCENNPEKIMMGFKRDAGRSYEYMEAAVDKKYLNWSLYFLEEMLVNWRENNVETFQKLLLKLAALSTVKDDDGKRVSYYPIDYEPFLLWLLSFYAPQEAQVTLADAKKKVAKYMATAVRREITDKMELTAQVAAAIKGNCEYDVNYARGGKLPPFNPNKCLATVRMGQDFRMYYAKPDISRTGKIKPTGARWEVLTPNMKNPSLLQVLKAGAWQTKHQQEEKIKKTFEQNIKQVMKKWRESIEQAAASGNYLRVQELTQMNPMDAAIDANEQLKLLHMAKIKADNNLKEIDASIKMLSNLGTPLEMNDSKPLYVVDYVKPANGEELSELLFGETGIEIDGRPALEVFFEKVLKSVGVVTQEQFKELQESNKWMQMGSSSSSRRRRPTIKRLSGPDVAKQLERLTRHKMLRRFDVHGASTQLDKLSQVDQNALLYTLANNNIDDISANREIIEPGEGALRRALRRLGHFVTTFARAMRPYGLADD